MKIKTGLKVVITSDTNALGEYGAASLAGRSGFIDSDKPLYVTGGLSFYSVTVMFHGTYSVREDHFRAADEAVTIVENEDLRWRRAADRAWKRIAEGKEGS